MRGNQSIHRGESRCAFLWTLALLLVSIAPYIARAEPPVPPVTSVSDNPRLPGKFIWADLVTYDLAAARQFYFELFNWRFEEFGNYTVAYNEDRPICGMFHRQRPEGHPEATSRWFGYISVPNVKRAQRSVTDAGGRVLQAPRKVAGRGEQAIFSDPEGALFGVMKSISGDPEDFVGANGDWIWIQLLTTDAKKSSAFYRGVAGYEVVENNEPNRVSDYVLTSKGYARATVRTIPARDGNVKPSWLPFVRVPEIQSAVKRAEELRGTVLIHPKPELLKGKVAVIADPAGAALGILEWEEGAVKGAR